jgi:hypothetical protein
LWIVYEEYIKLSSGEIHVLGGSLMFCLILEIFGETLGGFTIYFCKFEKKSFLFAFTHFLFILSHFFHLPS